MAYDLPPDLPDTDLATQAFEQMRGEMALVRRAVERLAAERADIIIPDYSATLGEMARRLAATAQSLKTLAEQPAMQIVPEELARRIDAAGSRARQSDHAAIMEAQSRFDQATHELRVVAHSARTIQQQRQHLYWAATSGVLLGMLLWGTMPGVLARTAPQSWQWPERMAARTLRLEPWAAGERLLAQADRKRWRMVLFGNHILAENREAIKACREAVKQPATPRRCTIVITLKEGRDAPRS